MLLSNGKWKKNREISHVSYFYCYYYKLNNYTVTAINVCTPGRLGRKLECEKWVCCSALDDFGCILLCRVVVYWWRNCGVRHWSSGTTPFPMFCQSVILGTNTFHPHLVALSCLHMVSGSNKVRHTPDKRHPAGVYWYLADQKPRCICIYGGRKHSS